MLLTHFRLKLVLAVLSLSALFPLSAVLAQQGSGLINSGLTIRADSPQSYLVVEGDTL